MMHKLQITLCLLGCMLIACAQAGKNCPPSEADLKPVTAHLEAKFEEIKDLHPCMDPKDAVFAMKVVGKDVVESAKYKPCNDGFKWDGDVSPFAQKLVDKCYKPADCSDPKVQKAFKSCAAKFMPEILFKYAGKGLDACKCFNEKILPNWKQHEPAVDGYFKKFKDTKG